MTENEANAQGVKARQGRVPVAWAASGRSLSLARDESVTKLLFDGSTKPPTGCSAAALSAQTPAT